MLPGPVFHVELLTLARRKRYYALRFVYGMFLLYVIWLNAWSLNQVLNQSIDDGLSRRTLAMLGVVIFSTLAFTQGIVILLITPALVAGAVAVERQRKTLQYLLTSRLSSGEIVLGKLAARMLNLSVYLGVGLPIAALLSFFGGVDPNHILLFFGGCVSTAFLLSAASIVVSVHARRPGEAVTVTYLLEMVWLFGPSIVSGIFQHLGGRWIGFYGWIKPLNEGVLASSPFFVLSRGIVLSFANPGLVYQAALKMIGVQLLCGTVLAMVAVLRLRRVNRLEGGRPGRLSKATFGWTRWFWPRPACGDDAIFWKERYLSRASRLSRVVSTGVFVMVVGLLGFTTYQVATPAFREVWRPGNHQIGDEYAIVRLNEYLRDVVALVAACWLLGTASTASSSLSGERDGDTWVSLIATPMTPLEIVRAKMFGAVWRMRWLGFLWLALILTGVFLGAVHPLGLVAEALVTGVYLWFACALGMFFSLRARNSTRALTATIVTLLICNGLYLVVLMPLLGGTRSSWPILGFTPYINSIALLSDIDVQTILNGTSRAQGYDAVDRFFTAIASLWLYALAAGAFSADLILNFDDTIDRPRTNGKVRTRRPGKGRQPAKVEALD